MIGKTNCKAGFSSIPSECVNIQLSTNQSDHSDLNGVTFIVSYESFEQEYTWEGSLITVRIPAGLQYTIQFNEVEGYKTPDNISNIAEDGKVRDAAAVYQTELLTVTVSSDDGEVSGYEITIAGTETIAIQTTATGTYKIPFDTVYTVSASSVTGYATPESQSFTAEQSVRNLTLVYTAKPMGIFIQHINGELVNVGEWTDSSTNVNGIAVLTENCEFVLSVGYSSAPYSTEEYSETLIDGVSTTTSYEEAILDYKGKENTAALVAAMGEGDYAAYNKYLYPGGNGLYGYLGAAGEVKAVVDNLELVKDAFDDINYSIPEWVTFTSTQYNKSLAWVMYANGEEGGFAAYKTDTEYGDENNPLKTMTMYPYVPQSEYISFKVVNQPITCPKGTTWHGFCNCALNAYGYVCSSKLSYAKNQYDVYIIDSSGKSCRGDYTIINGEQYSFK